MSHGNTALPMAPERLSQVKARGSDHRLTPPSATRIVPVV